MLARPNDNAAEDFVNYKFSPEEMKALEECNYESFIQRSLPLGTLCGATAWYAVKRGFMKGSATYGPLPKVIVASTIGYFIGKFSYQKKCAEKFMRLPNSKIGKLLRERQEKSKGSFGGFGGDFDPGFGSFSSSSPVTPGLNEPHGDIFSDISPRTYADLDTDRPIANFDDSFSQNFNHTNADESLPISTPSQLYTYDELRRKNREEYEQSKLKPYNRPRSTAPAQAPGPAQMPVSPQEDFRTGEQPPASAPSAPPSWNKQRNIYGDVWEK